MCFELTNYSILYLSNPMLLKNLFKEGYTIINNYEIIITPVEMAGHFRRDSSNKRDSSNTGIYRIWCRSMPMDRGILN